MKKIFNDVPTQVILWFVVVFLLSLFLTSCSTQSSSGHLLDGTSKFRAKEAFYSSSSNGYISYGPIKIITADSAYRAGDTVRLNLDDYILYEKVN